MLICPKCKEILKKEEHQYRCHQGHCFDIAKRGYVNLVLGAHKISGDDKNMVKARTNFLSHGYYQPLCDRLLCIMKELHGKVIVDAGCGEGYYTNQIKRQIKDIQLYGFDLSKYAIDEACKAKMDIIYGVCSIAHLPLLDASVDSILSVFAPIDLDENLRVLTKDGYFLKVGPSPKHLLQLKELLYKDVYENEVDKNLDNRMQLVHEETLSYTIDIENSDDIWALFQMTPYYWKTSKDASDALKKVTKLTTQIEFHIQLLKKI